MQVATEQEAATGYGRFSQADLEEIAGHRMGLSPRVGFGEKCALVIVDMTADVVRSVPACKRAADHIAILLADARKAKIPIFFTRGGHHYFSVSFASLTEAQKGIQAIKAKPLYQNSPMTEEGFEIASEIAPQTEEAVVLKPQASAFLGTPLEQLLNWHRVDTLIITGMSTTGCHYSTVRDAASYNYRVIVPQECCAGSNNVHPALHYLSLLHMDKSMGDVTSLSRVLDHLRNVDPQTVGAVSAT